MRFLGQAGYGEIAAASMRAKQAIAAGVAAIPGVVVHGSPELWAFSFGSPEVKMGRVAAAMAKRGWMCGPTTSPPGIHVMCTPVHEPIAADYVAAVAECFDEVKAGAAPEATRAAYN
jgi:glutamate/tyrosine decarboxylase-like PLP-dependent enzyme